MPVIAFDNSDRVKIYDKGVDLEVNIIARI